MSLDSRVGEIPASLGAPSGDASEPPQTPVRLLQVFVVALFLIPSTSVIPAVGAYASPAGLVALAAFGLWAAASLLGIHDPRRHVTPVRVTFGVLWIVTLLSYASMQFRDRTPLEANGADRWLMTVAGVTGIAFLAAEGLRRLEDVHRVLRPLAWAGAFCGTTAILQFFLSFDLAPTLGSLIPGFSFDDGGAIQSRGALNRVSGTLLHPIELGTTTAMLVPVVIYLAVHDRDRPMWARWTPAILLGASIPLSVSRSAVLAIAAATIPFVVQLPARRRLSAFAAIPVVLAGVFLTVRGLISTLTGFFLAAGSDTSVSTRTDDYPLAQRLIGEHPWFGQGGGSYLPPDLLQILDNAYLKTAIELGLVGVVGVLVFLFVVPVATAWSARRHSTDEGLRMLCSALGCGVLAAAVSSFTFDSLSYPAFTFTLCLLIGLSGACWRIAHEAEAGTERHPWTS